VTALLVDCGNTRAGIATWDGDGLHHVRHLGHDVLSSAGGAAALAGLGAISTAWMSSVAPPEQTARVIERIQRVVDGPIRRVLASDPVPGVTNGYRRPEQLGVDRLVAMVAAFDRVGGPVCVIDAGTAVTVDLVDASGQHLGGFILPGERLARESLLARTAIPGDTEVESDALLGRDTATALRLGSRYAVSGLVAQLRALPALRDSLQGMKIVVGGGDGARLLPLLPAGSVHLPDMVLHGLAVIARDGGR
jgi:type III pantothenate kinase